MVEETYIILKLPTLDEEYTAVKSAGIISVLVMRSLLKS